jgi:hypothetical protein
MEAFDGVTAVIGAMGIAAVTSERAGLLIILSWLLVAAAGGFLFFAVRSLFLVAVAQRNRTSKGRSIVHDALWPSSYDQQGRDKLQRAGKSGLLSAACLVAFFIAALLLKYVQ